MKFKLLENIPKIIPTQTIHVTQAPLHPAVPDPSEEIHELQIEQNLKCTNYTFPQKCNIYPYVQFWKQKLNAQDCHRVCSHQHSSSLLLLLLIIILIIIIYINIHIKILIFFSHHYIEEEEMNNLHSTKDM